MDITNNYSFKIISKTLKVMLLLGALAYLYTVVIKNNNWDELIKHFKTTNVKYTILIVVFFLSTINWGLEALKWKCVIRQHTIISYKEAYKNVLLGLFFGIYTPNRIGELIGRVWLLPQKKRALGTFSAFIASSSQLLVTLFMGIMAWLYCYYTNILKLESGLLYNYSFLIALFIPLLFLVYFKSDWLATKTTNLKWLNKLNFASQKINYSSKGLVLQLFLSSLRYLVFCTQYVLLLFHFGYVDSLIYALVSIPIIYFITTAIPSFLLGEIGVREAVAVTVFGWFGVNSLVVVLATFTLWFINLVIPSLVGAALFFNYKSRKLVVPTV